MSVSGQIRVASLLVAAGLSGLSAPSPAQAAGPVPASSRQPAADYVYRIFAGKSADWGGGSYAYWDPKGTFYAVNSSEQSIGFGRWYATTAGRMCYEAHWVWKQDFGLKESEVKTCTRYRVDGAGDLWSTTGGMSGPWFPFGTDNLTAGDSVTAQFHAMHRDMGLPLSR